MAAQEGSGSCQATMERLEALARHCRLQASVSSRLLCCCVEAAMLLERQRQRVACACGAPSSPLSCIDHPISSALCINSARDAAPLLSPARCRGWKAL